MTHGGVSGRFAQSDEHPSATFPRRAVPAQRTPTESPERNAYGGSHRVAPGSPPAPSLVRARFYEPRYPEQCAQGPGVVDRVPGASLFEVGQHVSPCRFPIPVRSAHQCRSRRSRNRVQAEDQVRAGDVDQLRRGPQHRRQAGTAHHHELAPQRSNRSYTAGSSRTGAGNSTATRRARSQAAQEVLQRGGASFASALGVQLYQDAPRRPRSSATPGRSAPPTVRGAQSPSMGQTTGRLHDMVKRLANRSRHWAKRASPGQR